MLDTDNNSLLYCDEFVDGLSYLFTESFEPLVRFIFKFYDFDCDGLISKEDLRIILLYVPLNTDNKYKIGKLKYENYDIKDRLESQEELDLILEGTFREKEMLTLEDYIYTIENINSDTFLFILILLLEKRPFNKTILSSNYKHKSNGNNAKTPIMTRKMIPSPSLHSKFSPSLIMQKSPSIKKRTNLSISEINNISSVNILNRYAANNTKNHLEKMLEVNKHNKEEQLPSKNPIRRKRYDLKNLENLKENVISKENIVENMVFSAKKYPSNEAKTSSNT